MAVQLAAAPALAPLMQPAIPPVSRHITYGFRRGADTTWEVTAYGLEAAAVAQRVLLSYVLGYEGRRELAERWSLGETAIQTIILGRSHAWLTLPVRERLIANGLVHTRRTATRAEDIRAALERLAVLAVEYLRWPHLYTYDEKEQVANDLWLISGAWRDQES